MNILITGSAGFIGFSLANRLLNETKFNVYGLDNLNNYYSINLKKKRISILKKHKKFNFFKIDLLNKNKLSNLFKNNKFDVIFHFAAQAGVRYVKTNPEKFIESNILGFHNIIETSKKYKISKFFYASSSSVYGDTNKFPVDENSKLLPKNIYGLSKKMNEEYINMFPTYKTKYIGLRFFTVYGEWGRPDMLIIKFLEYAKHNKTFLLNNSGNNWRDFTYIDDVVDILTKMLNLKYKSNEIFNICNGKTIYVKNVIEYLSKKLNFYKIKNLKKNNIEVTKTHGSNHKISKLLKNQKFSDIYDNIDKIIHWYKKYNHLI